MKYYSELTKKMYDTEDELNSAESEMKSRQTERGEAAKKVEDALKKVADDRKEAERLLEEFTEKYGAFHTSIKDPTTFKSFFDWLFDF